MDYGKNNYYRELQSLSLQDECKRCLNYHATLTMTDGSMFDGIIESVDADRVVVLVGEYVMEEDDENESDQQRQYHNPRRRFRRFRRRAFPLNALVALSLLNYPYIAPPYTYYYPY
ncbi:hypothetical protein [Clostridium gasigenes]|uniref:Uncharacterized protein n=1 Tax=Clostridium gasigenes TaxID=94869 RepID=A0A1H0QBD1_9CLOT|nr:hypothetical protein [Clostridium gasigenes]MBB6623343.1 hypothetical protein [Clostridium gasigenes]MBU3088032.1 hypothetical protein [Clostridium gasigenes]MBU3104232.1 hypothetical protein [Clostridium gasigenes]MBU3136790.1 hypothetical protein [Clostridium gasigenes]SDP13999.1 hypothetical protein SAMN04488529_102268 [Clostridium gasigenes]